MACFEWNGILLGMKRFSCFGINMNLWLCLFKQENVNKCCGERLKKRRPRERQLLVGPPSVTLSSHSRSQGIVLTEITPVVAYSNASPHNGNHHNNHNQKANGTVDTNVKLEVNFQGSEV